MIRPLSHKPAKIHESPPPAKLRGIEKGMEGQSAIIPAVRCGKFKSKTLAMAVGLLVLLSGGSAIAATPAGTTINNNATLTFKLGAFNYARISNTASIVVDEIVDLTVTTVDVANVPVTSGETQKSVTFLLLNNGNGNDSYSLANTVVAGSDFSPSSMQIYFDTNSSGLYDAGDTLYTPAVNDPALAAGTTLRVFVVSDMPLGLTEGDVSDIRLTVNSKSGTGPGTGDSGSEAIFGGSGGTDSDISTYEVMTGLVMTKTAVILDPTGGSDPLSGATVTYTITVDVAGVGTLTTVEVTDYVPANTSLVPSSFELNGTGLSNAIDADEGDFDATITNGIAVHWPNLAVGDGTQVIKFSVTID